MGKWREPIEDKIKRFVLMNDDGCWDLIPGATHMHKGYGCAWHEGRHQALHRLVYEVYVGPIPDGLDLGHKCHDEAVALGLCSDDLICAHRRCTKPDHLKPESRGENLGASGLTEAAKNGSKTACKRGHEFTPENTRYKKGTNWRSCRACDAMTPEERRSFDANVQAEGIDPE